jgi:tetratricopeptide (TPR) repeat protein
MSRRKKTPAPKREPRPAAVVAAPSPRSEAEAAVPEARRRSSPRWIAASVALVAVAAILLAFLVQRDRSGTPPPRKPEIAAAPAATYTGGAACATCHAKEHAAWKGSDHDLAMQVADEKSVLGDFANARFAYAGTTSTFSRRDGKYFVDTDGPDGRLADYEIKYTFGVRPLQQYLIEMPGGRLQALGIAWDSRPKTLGGQRWFHLYPGQNIKAGDPLHWTGVQQNWNFQCAECHSTNLRKNFDAKTGTFDTKWSELDVACEACHGPGSNHVAWANRQGNYEALAAGKGLAEALDERKGVTWTPVAETGNSKRSAPRQTSREIDTCARCHARTSRISDDDVHGKPLQDTHRLALLEDNLYWNDGQMRDEVYNWGSFVQSRMHAQGVTCSDCHDPHSLKLRAPANAVCAQCHLPAKFDTAQHTHHAEGTPGAACAACHMPTTTYMGVDARHDHSLRIPRPDVSAALGAPNACTNCHARQTAQWAADAILRWTGKPPAGYQDFGAALQAGSLGAPGARGALLRLIENKAEPALVRASAIQRLGHLATLVTFETLARELNDPDPGVRLATVEALANAEPATRQRYLSRMLVDPVRTVRIEAARALAGATESQLAETDRAAFTKALAEYVAAQTYNADRPEGRMSLGNLDAQRGDAAAAIAEYRKAIEIDPTFLAAYANLADLYRTRGAEGEAVAVLREGLARNPRGAVLHHALGLSLVRQKQTAESLKSLKTAADLAPQNARFAYVYAVALNGAGQTKEALAVLAGARKRDPYDRDVLSGLAFFTAQSGNREGALAYVKELRALDPDNPEYARMAQQFGSAPGRQ